ncbi:hypothetical protein [Sphingobacterium deserti]|uniref:Lipoprotein n=1 Tax=Sphingobacterium deserti TaxID=1229276 RepID=A0A0B8T108_9SPHI|nr:hypothetical protein [Sphingobacterium deserti]KGE14507.1 hypothetical protein DI53_1536 [Sphingobacterium deserti]
MKRLNYTRLLTHVFVTVMVVLLFSCEKKDGYATRPEFAPNKIELNGSEQTVMITAKNDVKWFLEDLTINGEILRPEDWDNDNRIKYHFSQYVVPNFPPNHLPGVDKIEFENWFVWERANNKTIKIHLSENKDGRLREISFQASVGNAADNISIVQKSND